MLYVSLDDWAEEIPSDEYEDTSGWLIEVDRLPEPDWLKEALFLNVYWSDSSDFRGIVNSVFGEVDAVMKDVLHIFIFCLPNGKSFKIFHKSKNMKNVP